MSRASKRDVQFQDGEVREAVVLLAANLVVQVVFKDTHI